MVYQLDEISPTIDKGGYVGRKCDHLVGAVLRGDIAPISIGKNSNIQDNSAVHTDDGVPCVVGENVTIGHNVILHSCTISDNVIVGMGSTLLNNAKLYCRR